MNTVIGEAVDDLRTLLDGEADPLAICRTDSWASPPNYELYLLLDFVAKESTVQLLTEATASVAAAKTPIGAIAMRFCQIPNDEQFLFDRRTCSESEPRFLKSLHLNRQRRNRQDRAPAIIYTDTDGTPVAYRKNNGESRVLLLEPTLGLPNLPTGTVIDFPRDSITNQQRTTRNPAVHVATFPRLSDAMVPCEILRPSTFMLDPSYVQSTGYVANTKIGQNTLGDDYTDLARQVDLSDIRLQVQELFEEI